jgi:hypothetical protein
MDGRDNIKMGDAVNGNVFPVLNQASHHANILSLIRHYVMKTYGEWRGSCMHS